MGAVTFRRQVPAEQYGSVTMEVTLDLPPNAVGQAEYAKRALIEAEQLVYARLAESSSANVRRIVALENPTAGEERWRQAEASAELELAIGRRENARSDDDESLEDLPFADE